MSRSTRKPFYKDRGMTTEEYWRIIRRNWKQAIQKDMHNPDLTLKNPKQLINDYDYSDYWFHVKIDTEKYGWGWNEKDVKIYSRK